MAALVMRNAGDPAEAVRAANAELAEYQQIRRWVVWPEPDLPRGPTGKILHRVVAAELSAAASRATSGSAAGGSAISRGGGTLAGLIAKIAGEDAAKASDSARLSEDLRLDSLGRVELQSAIETRFGISLNDADYQRAKTLGELKQLLQRPISDRSRAVAATLAHGEETFTAKSFTNVQPDIQPRADPHAYPLWPWSWPARAVRFVFQEAIGRPLVWLDRKSVV